MNQSPALPDFPSEQWTARLAESRTRILDRAQMNQLDLAHVRRVADLEANLLRALHPMPVDPIEHVRAAHAHARPHLERLSRHDPNREVVVDADHRYTPRRVLRRVLDHAVDHLNQVEQWLLWQRHGITPSPADGWATSADALAEDTVPLPAADLHAWLWRIDLVIEMLARRAEALRQEELDWIPPDGGWSLRHTLHHVASAEIYYAMWLDEALPDEAIARYGEASRRFQAHLEQVMLAAGAATATFYDGSEAVTVGHLARQVLAAEHALLAEGDDVA